MHDALVSPEVDGDGFETRQVRAEVRHHRVLCMADPVMLQDLAVDITREHPLVARSHQHPRLSLGISEQFDHGDAVVMVL